MAPPRLPPERWARRWAQCLLCQTRDNRDLYHRHYANGLCLRCYRRQNSRRFARRQPEAARRHERASRLRREGKTEAEIVRLEQERAEHRQKKAEERELQSWLAQTQEENP